MKDNGGYIYPQETGRCHGNGAFIIEGGKTLLDDFAGKAMQPLIEYFIEKESLLSFKDMAGMAYDAAEAMVEEKRKREE